MHRNRIDRRMLFTPGLLVAAVFAIVSASPAAAQNDMGFGLRFDLGVGWNVTDQTFFSDARWNQGALVDIQEEWRIRYEGEGGISPGAAVDFRFNRWVGVELEGRWFGSEPSITSDYYASWRWQDGTERWSSYRGYEIDQPELSSFVGSLNLVINLTDHGPVRPFVSFGASTFSTEIQGVHDTAYAYTYVDNSGQHLRFDYPRLFFDGDERTTGGNIGLGGNYFFQPNMAVTFMVKYYRSSEAEIPVHVPGNYPELSGFTLDLDPSFWLATGGIKINF